MKASIIVTDDSGNRWEVELPLRKTIDEGAGTTPLKARKRARAEFAEARDAGAPDSTTEASKTELEIDLKLPLRPFMNQYARSASGPRKFALLVAHIAKGNLTVEVPFSDIQKHWGKMTGILRTFNPAFTTRAKDSGWVDSPKPGTYILLPGWKKGAKNG